MICFSAIIPHPPLSIPNISTKDNLKKLDHTILSLQEIEEEMYVTRPDVVVVISPHNQIQKKQKDFLINLSKQFNSDFKKFGDFSTELSWKNDIKLASKIKHQSKSNDLDIDFFVDETLDHGAYIPLFHLTKHSPNINVINISPPSENETKDYLEFGKNLNEIVHSSNKRVAIIASADLSHSIQTDSPAGFHPDGAKFDKKIIEMLENKNIAGIANFEKEFIKNSQTCGWSSILILLGAIQNFNYTFKNYSYEHPFGVGYLVGEFIFP